VTVATVSGRPAVAPPAPLAFAAVTLMVELTVVEAGLLPELPWQPTWLSAKAITSAAIPISRRRSTRDAISISPSISSATKNGTQSAVEPSVLPPVGTIPAMA